jgi:hypothetical protein
VITVEDYTIEKTEGTYGPIWILTPKVQENDFYQPVHYVLRADWKMIELEKFKHRERSVHLDVARGDDPLKSHHGWKGAYAADSMESAVQQLIQDLNKNRALETVEQAILSPVLDLRDRLDDVEPALANFARQDIEKVMAEVELAYVQLMLVYTEAVKGIKL